MPKNLLNDEELKQLVMGSEYLSGANPTPRFATDHARSASTTARAFSRDRSTWIISREPHPLGLSERIPPPDDRPRPERD